MRPHRLLGSQAEYWRLQVLHRLASSPNGGVAYAVERSQGDGHCDRPSRQE
jgi:hypothetical protein